jgi:uncharacterized protein HemY
LLSLAHASSDANMLKHAQKQRSSGDVNGAIATLLALTTSTPDHTHGLSLLGDCLMETGDANQAHEACVALPEEPYMTAT